MDKIFAIFLDAFKAKNPKVWSVVVFALLVVQYGISQGKIFGVFPIEGTMQEVFSWLNWFVTLLLGSRTTNILNPPVSAALPSPAALPQTADEKEDELIEAIIAETGTELRKRGRPRKD